MTSPPVAESHKRRLKKRPLVWIRRILLGLVVSLVAIATAGLIYQAAAQQIDERNFPPPGRLVDISGYKLHISCIGDGSPTVILDAAGGNSSASWGLVQPDLARSTRVCAYDRAGMGWSERGPLPRDLKQHGAKCTHCFPEPGSKDHTSWLVIRTGVALPSCMRRSTQAKSWVWL